jgi:hypothetical protein
MHPLMYFSANIGIEHVKIGAKHPENTPIIQWRVLADTYLFILGLFFMSKYKVQLGPNVSYPWFMLMVISKDVENLWRIIPPRDAKE